MTNDLSPAARPGSLTLSRMSVEELRAELAKSISITAAHMQHLAAIWRELERRGEDLSDLKTGLWSFMPMIARGDLKAELVVKYAGYTTLLRRLATLPVAEQERLLIDDMVIVLEHRDGGWIEQKKALRDLRAEEAIQVINQKILAPEEQKRRAVGLSRRPARTMTARIIAHAQDEKVPADSTNRKVSLQLTDVEDAALKALASEAGVPVSRIMRAALSLSGLLKAEKQS